MSDFTGTAKALTPEIVDRFRQAIETGRWPDGKSVSQEQREILLQAVIVYENANELPGDRTGTIEDSCASREEAQHDSLNTNALLKSENK